MRDALKTILKAVFQMLALAAVLVLAGGDAAAGPIREFVRGHRPGILFPKRQSCHPQYAPAAPQCVCGTACTCPAGVCPAKCPVVVESGRATTLTPAPATRTVIGYRQECVNGVCRLVPVYGP